MFSHYINLAKVAKFCQKNKITPKISIYIFSIFSKLFEKKRKFPTPKKKSLHWKVREIRDIHAHCKGLQSCNLSIVSPFHVGTWGPNNYSIFQNLSRQLFFNLRNFGNKYRQFLSRFSELWTNYRRENCCQLLNTCSTSGRAWSKRLLNFHQFLYFSLTYNFLKFWHFKGIISKIQGFFFQFCDIGNLAQSLAEEQQIHPIYIFKKPKFPKKFWSKRQENLSEKITAKSFSSTKVIC